MIKALAGSRGLTVSDCLERVMAAAQAEGRRGGLDGVQHMRRGLKAKDMPSTRLRYIQEAIDSQSD